MKPLREEDCHHGCLTCLRPSIRVLLPALQASLRSLEHSLGLVGQQDASLVQLQQSVAPAFTPPASLARMMQRIAAKQVSGGEGAGVMEAQCSQAGDVWQMGDGVHAPAGRASTVTALCTHAD